MNKSILVLGDKDTGKTHFAIQLFGRILKSSYPSWKPKSTPENLEIFRAGFQRLTQGLAIEHTPSTFHQDIEFCLENRQGSEVNFTYPDYAGEQLRALVTTRRLNSAWQQRVIASTSWLLFIRLSTIEVIEDIVTRGLPAYGDIGKTRSEEDQDRFKLGDQAFYVELLQMLVRVKEKSFLAPNQLPQLTIMLSCWDEYKTAHGDVQAPTEALTNELPMLHSFLQANWPPKHLTVIGLSATGRKLDEKIPDEDYLDLGPETFGYWIDEQGEPNADLTEIISLLQHE